MFDVKVVKLIIEAHTNADALEIARIGDYQSIVRKGQFKTGDLAAYIPEQALVPPDLIEEMGLTGRLAGAGKNRVKAVKLRGVLSQGLCLAAREGWIEGQDVTEILGITKYEPEIPPALAGNVWFATKRRTLSYDIQNIKTYPHVLQDDEVIVICEKVHGTNFCCGAVLDADPVEGDIIVQSKGLGGKGLALKVHDPLNAQNLYIRASRDYDLHRITREARDKYGVSVYIFGEVFGRGVQDLAYGADNGQAIQGFRVFDVYLRDPYEDKTRFLNDSELDSFCEEYGLTRVPVLYRGPYSKEILLEMTNGRETVSGAGLHIREGVVVRPVIERNVPPFGRVQFKSISEAYLLRGGDATEFT